MELNDIQPEDAELKFTEGSNRCVLPLNEPRVAPTSLAEWRN